MRRFPRRPVDPSCVLALGLCAFTLGCPGQSTTQDLVVDLGSFPIDVAAAAGQPVAREIVVYGGGPTTSMRLDLDASGLPLNSRITIGTGRGTLLQEITTSGTLTSNEITGNVARVKVELPAADGVARVVLKSATLSRSTTPSTPAVARQPDDRVSAFPLRPGQTVDVGFPTAEIVYYFSFSAPHDGAYDVGYFGTGQLRANPITDPDFPLGDAGADRRVPTAGTSVPFVRYLLSGGDVLRMAVTNGQTPTAGRGRIVVMETSATQKLAFPSSAPEQFTATAGGVDADPRPGTRGPRNGAADCTDYRGRMGIQQVGGLWIEVIGIPPCYDTHQGTDWSLTLSIAGQAMQWAPVTAAASGIVLAVDDTHADKCFRNPFANLAIVCIAPGGLPPSFVPPVDNFVLVRQDDGLLAYFVHGKRGGSAVVPGQRVVCGELLTPAASAGVSSGPHLHFELRSLAPTAFSAIPPFATMDILTVRGGTTTVDPFGPTDRWRRKASNDMPEPVCS